MKRWVFNILAACVPLAAVACAGGTPSEPPAGPVAKPPKRKRIRRWLFNILAAVSLVICVATVMLWIRSYFVGDAYHNWQWRDEHDLAHYSYYQIKTGKGGISYNSVKKSYPSNRRPGILMKPGYRPIPAAYPTPTGKEKLGFRYQHYVGGVRYFNGVRLGSEIESSGWSVAVPLYAVTVLTAVVPCAWWVSWHRRRRSRRAGHCNCCGYDLTGNVSGTCPECGTAIPPRPPTAMEGASA